VPAEDDKDLVFRGSLANGTTFTKTFTFSGEGYGIGLSVDVAHIPFTASTLSLSWLEGSRSEGKSAYYDVYGPVALIGRTFEYENSWDWETGDSYGPGDIRWAGFTNSYFLAGMMPQDIETAQLFFRDEDETLETRLSTPWNGEAISYTLYVGPKDTDALNAVDPAFDRAIDFGWSHFIARPLVSLLRLLYEVTGNYGIAIILLTVLVKLVFFPLSNKSFRSMSAMKKLQPQMERLREQYKDDRQKLNQEMMELYKRYEVNPLGGCLPMVVQLPVFIGLYQGLLYAIELRQAPFFGWIEDLSQPDRLGALAIPFVDPPGIPVLTLLMGGSMVIQQMMMPTTGDPIQQKMMLLMPVIFTVMFINFPAGLVLYWLINNILSVAQQHWYTKTYG
jgi:YidC/Oxa1 family membrane protein insertase